jgi:predicted O-methyltransferase YrrM
MSDLNHPEIKHWTAVDEQLTKLFVHEDAALKAAIQANQKTGLPPFDLSPVQGKFLAVLVELLRPKQVLELGTLGGYSTIWIARALPDGGKVITLEQNPRHAKIAIKNMERAGVTERVELRLGAALDTLPVLEAEGAGPFDLVFIDADKGNYRSYLEWAIRLARPGGTILADNVIRDGAVVLDPQSSDPDVQGVRRMFEYMAQEPRLACSVLQTVGSKGHDGFVLAAVRK